MVEPIDPKAKFDRKHYFANPHLYKSTFYERVAPYASVIVNGIYWDQNFPRLLTIEQFENLHKRRKSRLLAVADLSCDPEGSIEFMRNTSSIDHPFYVWDPDRREVNWDVINAPGVLILAVDNLPTEIPVDATNYFGESLLPWVESLVYNDASVPFEEQKLPQPLKNAIVTCHGKLSPHHEYIATLRKQREASAKDFLGKQKKILILGSGMVSPPAIEYLARFRDNVITVASNNMAEAEKRVGNRRNVKAVEVDVSKGEELSGLIAAHDLVVSLLPAPLHPGIAKHCIQHKKHLITTSYVGPEMEELNEAATQAGVTILNEVGLDPGIDHFTALKIIKECTEQGGQVTSFTSFCGGLPAPEASDNPLGYKFSWAPRGALLAGLNSARYIDDGKIVEVPKGTVFRAAEKVNAWPAFNLEGYPNRDSVPYAKEYGIQNPRKFLRGSLRYQGFCKVFDALVTLGFVNPAPMDALKEGAPPMTWRDLSLYLQPDLTTYDLESGCLRKLGLVEEDAASVDEALHWLGIYSQDVVPQKGTTLDALCDVMMQKMKLEPHERDLVILRHEFTMNFPDGKEKRMTSSLVRYGEVGGHSAMATTVGVPCGIAAKLVLDGFIIRRGVLKPVTPDIYSPMLQHLEEEGISMVEKYY